MHDSTLGRQLIGKTANKVKFATLALALAGCIAMVGAQQPTARVRGRVVDAAGKGLAGVKVANSWSSWTGGPLEPDSEEATTGSDGSFEGNFGQRGYPFVLTAIDAARGIGGTVMLEKAPEGPVTLRAEPLSKLEFTPKFDGPAPESVELYVMHPTNRAPIAQIRVQKQKAELSVPAGTYQLWFYSSDTNSVTKNVEFAPGKTAVVADIELKLTGLARSYGKPAPPLTFSEVRGVARGFKLEDLKGKWVLLEFWGFW